MSLHDFLGSPWAKSHPMYSDWLFAVRPAPEFSTAEVAMASLYRACGYPDQKETDVPKAGRELDKRSVPTRATVDEPARIRLDTWRTVLHGVLESPKQPNQSSKRFLSLCPVVPEAALYSGSARLAGNSWNPGALIQRMVVMGSRSDVEANRLWDNLFDALTVAGDDDIWARWLQEEFLHRKRADAAWKRQHLELADIPYDQTNHLTFPAQQFVVDLAAVLEAKASMTRRQWTSLLEAVIRIGIVSHVLWLCRLNEKLWRVIAAILGQGQSQVPTDESEVKEQILNSEGRYLSYGNPAMPIIKNYVSGYLMGRAGLNLVLWLFQEEGQEVGPLDSAKDLLKFIQDVSRLKTKLLDGGGLDLLYRIEDAEARTIACKKGVGSNIIEFCRHTLGQRQTTNEALRGYDQSYFLSKRNDSRNAPWRLSLGPVAVLAVAHCCLKEVRGPRSIKRLSNHLARYGLDVDTDDIGSGELGAKLRTLGLVLDSPDAETGMLLIPPFAPPLKEAV